MSSIFARKYPSPSLTQSLSTPLHFVETSNLFTLISKMRKSRKYTATVNILYMLFIQSNILAFRKMWLKNALDCCLFYSSHSSTVAYVHRFRFSLTRAGKSSSTFGFVWAAANHSSAHGQICVQSIKWIGRLGVSKAVLKPNNIEIK